MLVARKSLIAKRVGTAAVIVAMGAGVAGCTSERTEAPLSLTGETAAHVKAPIGTYEQGYAAGLAGMSSKQPDKSADWQRGYADGAAAREEEQAADSDAVPTSADTSISAAPSGLTPECRDAVITEWVARGEQPKDLPQRIDSVKDSIVEGHIQDAGYDIDSFCKACMSNLSKCYIPRVDFIEPPVRPDNSHNRELLDLRWSELTRSEQEASCEAFGVDGIWSEVLRSMGKYGLMSEIDNLTGRHFFEEKCSEPESPNESIAPTGETPTSDSSTITAECRDVIWEYTVKNGYIEEDSNWLSNSEKEAIIEKSARESGTNIEEFCAFARKQLTSSPNSADDQILLSRAWENLSKDERTTVCFAFEYDTEEFIGAFSEYDSGTVRNFFQEKC